MSTELVINLADIDPDDISALASDIAQSLRVYPHYVRLTGPAPTEERTMNDAICRAMANMGPVKPGLTKEQRNKISFTRVRIKPDKAETTRLSTAYSRTHKPLELHTDSSFKAAPHELVAFQMVQADRAGGDTTLIAVEDILDSLAPDIATFLHREIFPFGRHLTSVFWKTSGTPHIRYYRKQIDDTCRKIGLPLDDEVLGALDALDAVLQDDIITHRFRMESGNTLFLHNTRVLHGRTGFAADSNRLMYRFRAHAGCLV